YLEAGSGAPRHIPSDFARAVKRVAPDLFLIIGGGIREARVAEELARSGADALVTGSLVEERLEAVREIIEAVRRASLEP
ncbi:MAG: geranylgeranylglyceryl/heptaprenylglyceryl phosphate synthase, partial [Fervidicoccaceae archaeon]